MASKEHARWLRANGHDLAPLTGTDARALEAIDACWTLYASHRDPGVLRAVAQLAFVMQPKCRVLARALIPRAMDWGDEAPVWALVEQQMVLARVEEQAVLDAFDR